MTSQKLVLNYSVNRARRSCRIVSPLLHYILDVNKRQKQNITKEMTLAYCVMFADQPTSLLQQRPPAAQDSRNLSGRAKRTR